MNIANHLTRCCAAGLLAAAGLALPSCYDDIGNYEYRDINEITFDTLPSSNIVVKLGEPITLAVPYHETMPNSSPDDYAYAWIVQDYPLPTRSYVYSTKRTLENELLTLPNGKKYTFYYRITDLKTGIQWTSGYFYIAITGKIASGLVLLSDVNDTARVDFINYVDGRLSALPDVLGLLGVRESMPVMGRPLAVTCLPDRNSPENAAPKGEQYMVAAITSTGAYRLNPNDFTYKPDYDLKRLMLGNPPADFYINRLYTYPGVDGVALMRGSDGNLYNYSASQLSYWTYGAPINKFSDNGQRFRPSPIVATTSMSSNAGGGHVLFDEISKSFVNYLGGFQTACVRYTEPADSARFFAFNNTGKKLVYMKSRTTGEIGTVYAILHDTAANTYELDNFVSNGTQNYRQDLTAVPHIAEAVQMAIYGNYRSSPMYEQLNDLLFYRTDEKIYVYSTSDRTSAEVFAAEAGHKISYMSFIRYGAFMDKLLVATYDPAAPAASCGTVQAMDVAPTYGTLTQAQNAGEPMLWRGLGKVVAADWKRGSD